MAIPLLAAAAVMAALEAGKYFAMDKPRENSQRNQKANETAFSSWSGRSPSTQIEHANLGGNVMSGAVTGAMLAQSANSQEQASDLTKAQVDYLKAKGYPGSPTAPVDPMQFNKVPVDPMRLDGPTIANSRTSWMRYG
jgi:hypothetical protein